MMGWLSNLFSSSSANASSRRKMALSTHDAFSLPTSSPLTASHPDSSARPSPDGIDVEVMTPSSSTYAYPPPVSPTTYDYVPRQNGRILSSQSRQSSLLPLHNNTPLSRLPPYPSLEQTWARLQRWLSREYPELGDTLNYGILPQDLAEIEMALGVSLPVPVRESYLIVDGQEAESSAGCSEGLFFGLYFLPLEDVLEEWRFWREVDNDPATGANSRLKEVMNSIPPGYVRRAYSQRGWIPLVTDKTGNYLGVDLNPDENGSVGQVIVFGRDFDTKVVMWRGDGATGWATWLAGFVDDLENGDGFELGQASDGSEGSEDDIGYESYFFDGSARAKGEGADAGGGMRLTGEYHGWSTLEAWADKSAKKWQQAGLLPSSPKAKAKAAQHGLGVLDLAAASSSSGAEVPIPVMNSGEERYDDQATPTAALTDMTNRTSSNINSNKPPPPLPTISVTRPPVPRPVELPSPQDFRSPSPTDSRGTSFDSDLERGRQYSLDEVVHPLSGASVAVKPPSPVTPTARRPKDSVSTIKEATLVQISLDEPSQEKTSEDVSDLLQGNEEDAVTVAPLEPVSTPVGESKPILEDPVKDTAVISATSTDVGSIPLAEKSAEASKVAEPTKPEVGLEEAGAKAQTTDGVVPEEGYEAEDAPEKTIRLVGSGGSAGAISSEPEPMTENDPVEAASLSSDASARNSTDVESTKGVKGAKHEKKKSLTQNLKRMSKFGGSKRRTDSKENHSHFAIFAGETVLSLPYVVIWSHPSGHSSFKVTDRL
ncbi:SMI1 [Sanghuangporus vaninii]